MDTQVYPRFRIFVGLAAATAWINIGWVIVCFAPLLPFIAKEFSVPVGTVMIGVMALNSFAGGTGVILCGPLVDKFGPRKVLFVSAILLTACSLAIPFFSHSFTQVVILRLFSGALGFGPLFAGKAAMAQRWFPRNEQSTWIGIWNSAFAVGVAAMYQAYFPLLTHYHFDWRQVGAFSWVPSAIMAVFMLITLFGKEPAVVRRSGPSAIVEKDFSVALKLPVLWAGAILLGCAQGIMQSINGLTASFLQMPKPVGLDWRPEVAGPTMTFVQIGMILSGFLIGAMMAYIFRGSYKWQASSAFLLAGLAVFFLTSGFAAGGIGSMKI